MEENTVLVTPPQPLPPEVVEKIVIGGDLSPLNAAQRAEYYAAVCRSLGLNPLTKPFEYLNLNGKLRLYALRDCADQLRRLHGISIYITNREQMSDIYIVTARAKDRQGREDESTGAVTVGNLRGDALANALMKAECVPLDSEILTREGWKAYDQVRIGEEVLAYACADDATLWTPLADVRVYDRAPVVRLVSDEGQFDILCTPDHSWPVAKASYIPDTRGDGSRGPRGAYRTRRPDRFLVKVNELKTSHRLILAAPEPGPEESVLSPTEAAILGWAVTDGTIQQRGRYQPIGICQSKATHFPAIREVVSAIAGNVVEVITPARQRTFPTSGRTNATLPQHWWYLPAAVSRDLLAKAGFRARADLPRLVSRLSSPARKAMLQAMMLAEGDARGRFANGDRHILDTMQMLCALEGIATGVEKAHSTVRLVRLKKARHVAASFLRVEPAGEMAVWCPTTAYGTWVMRQRGRIMITGNTKAKRRVTLSIAGLGWLDETELETIPQSRPGAAPGQEPHDEVHPSADQISSLVELARSCGVDLLGFGRHMRQLMDLPEEAKITKKFLRESMTMAQYDAAWQYYSEVLKKHVEEDVLDYPPPGDHASPGATETVTGPVEEGHQGDATEQPSPSDAPSDDTYATPHQIAGLKRLAQQVGDDAYADVQDLLDRHPEGLVVGVYESVKQQLKARKAVKKNEPLVVREG